jgi:hypothetical protein
MDEEIRLRTDPAARLTAIADHLERAKQLERIADNLATAGQVRHSDALKARYCSVMKLVSGLRRSQGTRLAQTSARTHNIRDSLLLSPASRGAASRINGIRDEG